MDAGDPGSGDRPIAWSLPICPGHGTSEVADGPLDADRVLAWLGELIERTCPTPPALVGQILGGAIAARFASDHGDRLSQLVLVDALGLAPFQPAPEFGLALTEFIAEPTEDTHDRLWRRCAFDLDGMRERMGESWEWLKAYNLDRARTPSLQAAQHSLMEQFGMPAIPPAELARIAVPTTLIWGRHDLATQLRDRRGRERPLRMAAARDRERRRRSAHRAARSVPESACARWRSTQRPDTGGRAPVSASTSRPTAGGHLVAGGARRADRAGRGPLLRPGDDGWDESVPIWNAMVARVPALVFSPPRPRDVAVAIGFAPDHGLLLSIKGGGHNIAGTSIAEHGLTLDMSRMRDVTVDPWPTGPRRPRMPAPGRRSRHAAARRWRPCSASSPRSASPD